MAMESCRLCSADRNLQNSHILPAFIYRWLCRTSATGYIRSGAEPNRRVQDGEKRQWLCSSCEGILSKYEKKFAERLFHPFVKNSFTQRRYGDWLLKFCVSIS